MVYIYILEKAEASFCRIPGTGLDNPTSAICLDLSKVANIQPAHPYFQMIPNTSASSSSRRPNSETPKIPLNTEGRKRKSENNIDIETKNKIVKFNTEKLELKNKMVELESQNNTLRRKLDMFCHLLKDRKLLNDVLLRLDSERNGITAN